MRMISSEQTDARMETVSGERAAVITWSMEVDGAAVEVEEWRWELPADADGPRFSFHVTVDGEEMTCDGAYDEWPSEEVLRDLVQVRRADQAET